MNDKNNVIAVVVTYNRLELLKKVIEALRNQTYKLDSIIVINNSSIDGTEEWLKTQEDLKYITQDNVGGAGGFNTGLRYGYEAGYEWIWFMDDDVVPRSNCLEVLMKYADKKTALAPLRYTPEGKPFFNECVEFNFSNPFKTLWSKLITKDDIAQDFINIDGMTFEGILIHKALIDAIGLPVKQYFLYGDDSDYFIRAKKAGFKIGIVPRAKCDRILTENSIKQWNSPRRYYMVRNVIILDRLYGNFWVRNLRPLIYFVKWFFSKIDLKLMNITLRGFIDGWKCPEEFRNNGKEFR
ncbi:MAG TPA: glycosyltransferase family 2 protein [Candidatus Kapabacteria bacterium]|jgi:GT2 family glycosyltransferase|nr:glycosyltransferase family 2 protein [Candidatus Kapabacteria bacterium]